MSRREVAAEVRVRYADTDQMGVAHYANYFVWFEVGRSEYMRVAGYPYRSLEAQALHLPVVEASCNYRQSARYDDLLDVRTRVDEVGAASVRFGYTIVRRADDQVLAAGSTRHATVGEDGRLRRLPEEVKECLSS